MAFSFSLTAFLNVVAFMLIGLGAIMVLIAYHTYDNYRQYMNLKKMYKKLGSRAQYLTGESVSSKANFPNGGDHKENFDFFVRYLN